MENTEIIKHLKVLIAENEQLSFLNPNSPIYYTRIAALCKGVLSIEEQEELQQINKELVEALAKANDYIVHMSVSKGNIYDLKGKLHYIYTVYHKATDTEVKP